MVKIGSFAVLFILKSFSDDSALVPVTPSWRRALTFIEIEGNASLGVGGTGEILQGLDGGLELEKLGSKKCIF